MRAILSHRREVLDDVETITAYALDLSLFLNERELTERRAFIESFVNEIVVMPDNAVVRYTIPISQSTPKTQLLLGGRSEEFWVSNEAEASNQLVWDVERRLSPAGNWHHTIINGRFGSLVKPSPQHTRVHQLKSGFQGREPPLDRRSRWTPSQPWRECTEPAEEL